MPFLSPMRESEVAQSCPTLSDPMDCSPPGSSLSMGFSRREYWSGVPLPSLKITVEISKKHSRKTIEEIIKTKSLVFAKNKIDKLLDCLRK